ncbi:hypothetical protein JB92DRAFT_1548489 [Gautieria morchelliformis]|nr:hypothetical protein JB92DRAFT_1548489 [Gautieria morchelliformis]
MWLGIAAGLSLLTCSLARPIHARDVSLNDQQLIYKGVGWQVGAGPQACRNISQTVHTTSTTGNFVTFNFIGLYRSQMVIYIHTNQASRNWVDRPWPSHHSLDPHGCYPRRRCHASDTSRDWARRLRNTLYRWQYRKRFARTYVHYDLRCKFRVRASQYQRYHVRPSSILNKGLVSGELFVRHLHVTIPDNGESSLSTH